MDHIVSNHLVFSSVSLVVLSSVQCHFAVLEQVTFSMGKLSMSEFFFKTRALSGSCGPARYWTEAHSEIQEVSPWKKVNKQPKDLHSLIGKLCMSSYLSSMHVGYVYASKA